MRPSIYAGLALLAMSGAALAQQPLTLPGRAQSSGQQAVDNAACYAFANSTTKVNMARESQTPPKNNSAPPRAMNAPSPVAPPLPPTASGALAASGASAAVAASGAKGASATAVASASAPVAASGAAGASAAMPGSGAMAASGAMGASDGILGGDMKMPPLPPPEPPMVRYWRAYSDCMQGKGYYVK